MASCVAMTESSGQATQQAFKSLFGGTSESVATSASASETFLKKFLAAAISNVAYLRAIMPEESFRDRFMGDLHLKVISTGKSSHPIAKKLVEIIAGCFDGIEKKYLRTLTVWFHQELDKPEVAIEAYVFRFDYCQDETSVTMSRNEKIFAKVRTGRDVKDSVTNFLKMLVCTVEELDPLPPRVYLKMQVTYYDSRTPIDYHPPGFHHGTSKLAFSRSATQTLDVGSVVSNHHAMGLRIKTTGLSRSSGEERPSTSAIEAESTHGLDFDEKGHFDVGETEA